MTGTLALVGGDPFAEGGTFNRALVEAAGATQVAVLPTAAAFENPEAAVARAAAHFEPLGVGVRPVMVIRRDDANDLDHAEALRVAPVIYLIGSSGMHARPTLQDTAVWQAVVEAWQAGATVIGSDAGAQVVCDPMVDDRGGAFTVGLGLIDRVAAVTRLEAWSADALHRLRQMTNPDLAVIGIESGAVAVRSPEGAWSTQGNGRVEVHLGADPAELGDLQR